MIASRCLALPAKGLAWRGGAAAFVRGQPSNLAAPAPHLYSRCFTASEAAHPTVEVKPGMKYNFSKLHGVPTLEMAKAMPTEFRHMSNTILLSRMDEGDSDVVTEILIRNIMATDKIDWVEARNKLEEIQDYNRAGMYALSLPYRMGILLSGAAAFCCIPMVFHKETVLIFNELAVTSDVPEAADLETHFEVGSWAWDWMEPMMGTFSFVLLSLQFAKAQMKHLGIGPYTQWVMSGRVKRLQERFPQYNCRLLSEYVWTSRFKQTY